MKKLLTLLLLATLIIGCKKNDIEPQKEWKQVQNLGYNDIHVYIGKESFVLQKNELSNRFTDDEFDVKCKTHPCTYKISTKNGYSTISIGN